jgi:hypothetical protein
MFCPQCKAEYRQGFYRCADCDVDLVDELRVKQVPAASASMDAGVRVLWRGISQDSCVSVCLELRNKGIPYQVAEFPTASALRLHSSRRYVLAVSSDDYERAKAAVGLDEDPPAAFSEEQWTEMENPEDPDQPEDPTNSSESCRSVETSTRARGFPRTLLQKSGRRPAKTIFPARSK